LGRRERGVDPGEGWILSGRWNGRWRREERRRRKEFFSFVGWVPSWRLV